MKIINKILISRPGQIILVLALLFFSLYTSSQNRSSNNYQPNIDFLRSNPVEKIYLHTDRDIYAQNDTIWFKVYLLNAHTFTSDPAPLRNMYVELYDQNSNLAARNMLAVVEGSSYGDFILHQYKLKPGKYNLRAYTAYQSNFPAAFLFQKNILITPVLEQTSDYQSHFDSIINRSETNEIGSIASHIDLQFLPEGGKMTSGISNNIAFKALDALGNGIDIEGSIYDSSGNKLTGFASSHRGMGKVTFKPEKDLSYYAEIDGYEQRYPLPPATDLLLMTISNSDSMLNIRLKSNTMDVDPAKYYLLISSRGMLHYSTSVWVDRPYLSHKVAHSRLPMGINQITLLDSMRLPLRDRLVFIDKNDKVQLDLKCDKETLLPFEQANIEIKASYNDGRPVKNANLSLSVTDGQLSPSLSGYPLNIFTSLMLESDLKGHIEAPGYYFDESNKAAAGHLDLLMLTQGWSDYNWNELVASTPEIAVKKQYGITMTGSATQDLFRKTLKNTLLTLSMKQNEQLFHDSITTDDKGEFVLTGLVLPDSTEIAFAVPEKRNRKQSIKVNTFMAPLPLSSFIDFELPRPEKIEKYQQQASKRYSDDKENHPWKYEILLEDILVKKIVDDIDINDSHLRPYPKADMAVITDENDLSYPSPLYFLSRSISRVFYDGQTVYIKGLSNPREQSSPMFLLDGMEVDQLTIENLPMDVVERIEVVYEPSSLIMWPHNSLAQKGGVIAVYTKRLSNYDDYSSGELLHKVRGYYESRKFYSPKYENKQQLNQNDRRTTLLWAPVINTDENGIARVSFYNANRPATVKISLEGISPDGKAAFIHKLYNGKN